MGPSPCPAQREMTAARTRPTPMPSRMQPTKASTFVCKKNMPAPRPPRTGRIRNLGEPLALRVE